jgi:hypothetical protein
MVWDVGSGQAIHTLKGHNDEILDVCFNAAGTRIATASADGTSRVYQTDTGSNQAILAGHEGEIESHFQPHGVKGTDGELRQDGDSVGGGDGRLPAEAGGALGRDFLVRLQLRRGRHHHGQQGQHVSRLEVLRAQGC